MVAGGGGPPAQRLGQSDPVGQLPQQRRTGMPDYPGAIGGDFEAGRAVGSLHPQGALLEPVMQPSDSRILPAYEGSLRYLGHLNPTPHEKPRLVPILLRTTSNALWVGDPSPPRNGIPHLSVWYAERLPSY